MKKIFRVLVIDDNQKVLDGLPKRLTIYNRVFEKRDYSIDLVAVHINLETNDDNSKISTQTLKELETACKKPLSLILVDFGYATDEVWNSLYELQDGKNFTKEELKGKILTTADLAEAVEKYSSKRNSLVKKNFINSNAKFYLYSYVSEKFYFAFGSMQDRVNLTNSYFRNCKVEPVDTKEEFYGGEEFNSKYSPEFYAHQASKLLNRIIQHEFVEFILKDSQRRRYTRLKQTASIVGILIIVGFASEFAGEYVFKIYDKGDIINGIVFGLISVIALVVIGSIISYFIEEKIAKGIVSDIENEDAER